MSFPLAPWHTWGSTEIVNLVIASGTQNEAVAQLVRVSYKRPETWHFVLFAEFMGITGGGPLDVNFGVDFEIITGIGRDVLRIPGPHMQFGGLSQAGALKWTDEISASVLDDGSPTAPVTTSKQFVGEDIQISAKARVNPFPDLRIVTVKLGAFVSPNVHVRPEWFKQEFRGGEEK